VRRREYVRKYLIDIAVADQQEESITLLVAVDYAPAVINATAAAAGATYLTGGFWGAAAGAIVGIATELPAHKAAKRWIQPWDRRRRQRLLQRKTQTVVKAGNRDWIRRLRRK
jgi:hypothetical protein